MSTHSLFPSLQSAYRKYHSTETAVLKVKNDLLLNMNNGHMTNLVLLHLSAAFDTVDHNLLLQKLQSVIGIQGTALFWFQSYLGKRSQQISINGTLSQKYYLQCGIPQGSCLEPLLFTIHLSKLFEILKHHAPTNSSGIRSWFSALLIFQPCHQHQSGRCHLSYWDLYLWH